MSQYVFHQPLGALGKKMGWIFAFKKLHMWILDVRWLIMNWWRNQISMTEKHKVNTRFSIICMSNIITISISVQVKFCSLFDSILKIWINFLRLKSTFDSLTLTVFSFWPSNFKNFHLGPLCLSCFQNDISVKICYSISVKCHICDLSQYF